MIVGMDYSVGHFIARQKLYMKSKLKAGGVTRGWKVGLAC